MPSHPLGPFQRNAPARVPRRPIGEAEHAAFQKTVYLTAAGAGAVTLVADLVLRWTPSPADASTWMPAAIMAGALGAVGGGDARRAWVRHGVGALTGLAAGGAFAALGAGSPGLAVLALGVASMPILAPRGGWGRRALQVLASGLLGAAGAWVAQVLWSWQVFDPLVPGAAATALCGAAGGMFVGLGSGGKHLMPPEDPVEARYRELLGVRDGEVADLLQRALRHYRSMCREPEALGELAGELRPIMLQLAAAAAQLRRLQQDLEEWTPRELEQQTERLLRKAEDHDDPVARETLEQAAESLRAQMAALTRIDRGRQRVLARLHADVALLERLRFSLIQLRASAAEPAGVPGHTTARLDGLREGLDALQEGLDATVSTLSEVTDPARALSRSLSG